MRLKTGDVLPARQLALQHGHETGWEAVRLSHPRARPWTGARLPKTIHRWHDVVVLARVTVGPEGKRLTECASKYAAADPAKPAARSPIANRSGPAGVRCHRREIVAQRGA